jgi:ABC-2 type transport system permease protein
MATMVRIARAELLQYRRSGVLVLVGLALAALIATSAVVAWRAERAYDAERQRYAGDVADRWAAQPDRHPHRVAHYGYLLFRPRSPLGFFDAGVSAHTG